MENSTKRNIWIAVTYAGVLLLGILLGQNYVDENQHTSRTALIPLGISDRSDKIRQTLDLIGDNYVDSVNLDSLQQLVLSELVGHLDSHSEYLSPREARDRTQALEGSFDGIGVEYYLLNDTLLTVGLIHGGPAQQAGLKVGDKILAVNGTNIAGVKVTEEDLEKQIIGRRGSVMELSILRDELELPFPLKVTRDKMEIGSIDAAYLIAPGTAYVKIKAFGSRTVQDFQQKMEWLLKEGAQDLILDLRGNRGGYFAGALELASQFLEGDLPIVYTEGRNAGRKGYFSTGDGVFLDGGLVILIDNESASSSEIVAAAIQDHQRGLIIGSPSFGKGLVQARFGFGDGAALNLTVARYFTPLGRNIQRPDQDQKPVVNPGPVTPTPKNLNVDQSLGGADTSAGGVIPDIHVESTLWADQALFDKISELRLIPEYVYTRLAIGSPAYSVEQYLRGYFLPQEEYQGFLDFIETRGLEIKPAETRRAKEQLSAEIEALLGRYYFGSDAYFKIKNRRDPVVAAALEQLTPLAEELW